MKLIKISAKNFRSFINLDLSLDNKGLVLVEGENNSSTSTLSSNAAGKSTALSTIYYAIYGELPTGEKADNVINKSVGKNTSVELVFSKGNDEFIIRRGRKPNYLKLFANGNEITLATMKDTQNKIEELVGFSEEIYLSSLYFDGHNSTPFSELTDKQKKEYLETLFNIGIYQKAYEVTKEDIKSVSDDLTDCKNSKLLLDERLKSEKERYSYYKSSKDNIVSEKSKVIQELTKFTEDNESSYKASKSSLEEFKSGSSVVSQESYNKAYKRMSELNNYSYKINNYIDTLKVNLNRVVNLLKEDNEKANGLKTSDVCLVCGNPIDEEHRQKEIAKLKNEISEYVEKYTEINKDIKSQVSRLHKVEEDINLAKKAYEKEKEILAKKSEEATHYKETLERLTNQVTSYENKVSTLRGNLDYLKRSENDLGEFVTKEPEINKDLEENDKKLNDLVDKKMKLDKALVAFSDRGIKSHVLDLVTPELNRIVNSYLSKLTGSLISVEFSTQKKKKDGTYSDKFDIAVNNNGQDSSYESLSSGEKRRVDVAISLTLQDMVMTRSDLETNVIVYDEIFEGLDSIGSENVIEILKEKAMSDSIDSIFVITHNESLKPLFSNYLKVVKNNKGESKIDGGDKN